MNKAKAINEYTDIQLLALTKDAIEHSHATIEQYKKRRRSSDQRFRNSDFFAHCKRWFWVLAVAGSLTAVAVWVPLFIASFFFPGWIVR